MTYVGDKLALYASRKPDDIALTSGAESWTWQRLVDDIGAIEALVRTQTAVGGRVALLLDDPARLLVSFFACARTTRIAMVMDTRWPDAQLESVLKSVQPDMILDAAVYAGRGAGVDRVSGASKRQGRRPMESDPFYCGFTSGSTGTPKGYLRTHGSWLRSFELSDREFSIPDRSRIVLAGQLTHSLHLYGAVCGLAGGHEVVVAQRFDPRAHLTALSEADHGAVLYAVPTQLHYLMEAAKRSGPVETVCQVLASGAKWSLEDRKALSAVFPRAALTEFYGASETSFVTIAPAGGNTPSRSVGYPPKGVELLIGDPEQPLPVGDAGPIWVKSAMLFSRYLCGDDPQTRWKDGWLTFGDHGFLDAKGFLFLTGRANRMIITSGMNVYPEEIEVVLMSHPSVAAAVVAGLEDAVRGQRLEAVVKLRTSHREADPDLGSHCRRHLPAGKIPRKIHLVGELPLTAGGKPDIQRVTLELSGQGKERA